MARLKLPGRITESDLGFSRRLEFEAPVPKAETAVPKSPPPSSTTETVDALPPQMPAGAKSESKGRTVTRKRRQGTLATLPPEQPTSDAEMVTVRVLYRLPDDLLARATSWADKARCPPGTILRRAMSELRPDLVATLEAGIDYRDIPPERARSSSHRFDSSITLSRDAYSRLCREIDPEGIAGLTPALSRWVRAKAIAHLETYLTRAGY